MGKSELVEKILADARAKAASLDAERARRVAEAGARAEAERNVLAAENAELTRREVEVILERARSTARLQKRSAVLAARWQAIDRVIERTKQRLLADSGYAGLVVGLAKKYAKPGALVRLSPADTERFGKRLPVAVGQPAPIDGGVIIVNGREELNFSLGDSLAEVKQELAAELSRVLFPG
jgi:vacuolar-type H+-ATPase subunit E/Vma4